MLALGEFPDGVYRLSQQLTPAGEPRTTMTPLRKRWWWLGPWVVDERGLTLCRDMERLKEGRHS